MCGGSDEIHTNIFTCGGGKLCFLNAENMIDPEMYSDMTGMIVREASRLWTADGAALCVSVEKALMLSPESCTCADPDELLKKLYSGWTGVLVDGVGKAYAAASQGFKTRSISAPTTEVNITGAKEGFVESVKVNQTMIRRRIRSPKLRFEQVTVGGIGKTPCVIAYIDGEAETQLVDKVRKRLSAGGTELVDDDGAIRLLLCDRTWSLFPDIGRTERPDTVCAKLYSGRVAVLVDGSPFALIVPYIFTDYFESVDDYTAKTAFSNMIRLFKYLSFFIAVTLPGFYVAVVSVHPELMPRSLLLTIASAQQSVPFALTLEMLVLLVIYEIMREAGLRLPREVGHAVSIVGSLVIGETATTAGLISAPTILVAAVAAISTFLVPQLSESCVVMRFALVLLGGGLGLLGMSLGLTVALSMLCRQGDYGLPMSTGFAPADKKSIFKMVFKGRRQAYASPDMPKTGDLPGRGSMEKDDE